MRINLKFIIQLIIANMVFYVFFTYVLKSEVNVPRILVWNVLGVILIKLVDIKNNKQGKNE